MTFTTWLVLAGFIALAVQAHINKEAIMATLAELEAAIDAAQVSVDAARTELEADKVEILAEIARLGLPDADVAPLVAKVEGLGAAALTFGSILDDVPGVADGDPVPDPEPSPEPTPEG